MGFVYVEAGNIDPIFCGVFLALSTIRESKECDRVCLSLWYRGTAHILAFPTFQYLECSWALVREEESPGSMNRPKMSNAEYQSVLYINGCNINFLGNALTYFPGSSLFSSFMPGGSNQAPGKNPKPIFASLNSPGRRPLKALFINFAFIPFGK